MGLVPLITMAAAGEPESTLYVISDGDEIPNPEAIQRAAAEYDERGPRVLPVDNRYWFANWSSAPNGTPAPSRAILVNKQTGETWLSDQQGYPQWHKMSRD